MNVRPFFALAATTLLFTALPAGAAEPAAKCQSAKVKAMGKFVACRTKAEAKAAVKEVPVDTAALAKCGEKFLNGWNKADLKGDGQCSNPPGSDETLAEATSVVYADWAAQYVAGGEPDICAGTCDQCEADLQTCQGDLAVCQSSEATCQTDLGTCNGSLSTCQADLLACQTVPTCEAGARSLSHSGSSPTPTLALPASATVVSVTWSAGIASFSPVGITGYLELITNGGSPVEISQASGPYNTANEGLYPVPVALTPGNSYELQVSYDTTGVNPGASLSFEVLAGCDEP